MSETYQRNIEIENFNHFDILLAFNYRAVIESEQQLTRFRVCRRTHTTSSLDDVYGCFQKVALCATLDSMVEVRREDGNGKTGKSRGKEREREGKKGREKERNALRKCCKSPQL